MGAVAGAAVALNYFERPTDDYGLILKTYTDLVNAVVTANHNPLIFNTET